MSSPLHGTPPSDVEQALARLQASRLQLRHALVPAARSEAAGNAGASPLPRRLRALLRCWRQRLRQSPVAATLMGSAQAWWWQQPWREPAEAAAAELRGAIGPVVRRHPVAAVLLAGVAGAALMAWRPWRWPVVARQFSPLPRRVGRWLMAQFAQPAVQSVLGGLLMSWLGRAANAPPPSPSPSPPAAPAAPEPPAAAAPTADAPAPEIHPA